MWPMPLVLQVQTVLHQPLPAVAEEIQPAAFFTVTL
jgi:hypothetical protein